jgi:toxin FitB
MGNWPDHKDIPDDEILNAVTASPNDPTGLRYDRILQYRARQATGALTDAVRVAAGAIATTDDNLKASAVELAKKLEGVMETIHRAADRTGENLRTFGDPDAGRRSELNAWLTHKVRPMFEHRVLAVTEDIMFKWRLLVEEGRKAGHTFSQPDLIIAATAQHHGLTVVSRDTADYIKARIAVFNPWIESLPPMT